MPRKRKATPRVQVRSSDRPVGLGVHAPSFTRTQSKSANQAAALSEALGFGQRFAGATIRRHQEKAFLRGTEAFLTGRELTEEEQKSDAFVFGFKSSQHDRKLIEFKSAAEAAYAEARNKEDFEFNSFYDGFAKEFFGDSLDPESDLGREFIPRTAELLESHREYLLGVEAETARGEVLDRTGENLLIKAQDTTTESGTFTAEQWSGIDREAFTVGGPEYAQGVTFQIAKQFAADGNVEALEALPAKNPNGSATFRSDPDYAGQYDSLLSTARKARRDSIEAASAGRIGKARAEIAAIAESGASTFPDLITAASTPNEDGIAVFSTPAQIASMWTKWLDAREKAALEPMSINAWIGGDMRQYTNAERETGSSKAAEAVVQRVIDGGGTPEEAASAGRLFTVERSVVHDYVPKWVQAELSVNPKNPQAFQNAVQLYDQFEEQQPGFMARNLDSHQVELFDRYKRLVTENGGDAEAALEIIGTSDKNLVTEILPSDRNETRDEIIDSLSEIADDKASAGIFNFASAEVKGSTRNRKLVTAELEWYLSRGYSLEQAKAAAVAALDPVNGRMVQVDGELYKKNAGWGTYPSEVADHARQTYAEANQIDADDVEIVPIPNKSGQVWIKDRSSVLAGGMTPVSVAELTKSWTDSLTPTEQVDRTAAATKAQDEARAQAVEAAKNSLYPLPEGFGIGTDVRRHFATQERERRWNALTDDQRDRLIRRSSN